MRPDLVADVSLTPDTTDPRPLPTQLAQQLKTLITTGLLNAGDHLPSTRTLAQQTGVSRGTIVATYELLIAEGFLVSISGSGTKINPELGKLTTPAFPHSDGSHPKPPRPTSAEIHLTPGLPDTSTIVDATWRAAWRKACTAIAVTNNAPEAGDLNLRNEISEHLRLMRGLVVEPERIFVTAGSREGLTLFLRALPSQHPTAKIVGVEAPGFPSLRRIPESLGFALHNIATDSAGLNPKELQSLPDNQSVLITPSHQYPYGGVLSGSRRIAIAHWARDTGSIIIEDDFDSELRYVGQPVPALAALAPENTVLLGTFSAVVSPAVACGYLVVPHQLIPALTHLRSISGQPVSSITQTALTHFMRTGALRRHIVRLRRIYRRRRDSVMAVLTDLPNATLLPITGGLHAVLLCTRPAHEIVAECAKSGIHVTALEDYWGGDNAENGIVFGFGCHDDDTLDFALHEIAHATRSK
ncbi:MocR-like pyridoxine biosynthesis transcription factor PdxR [Corynebacterium mustelae]|nr:PLP-dependent aminotransferase family protein [Corynebacterium mustelae]